jgi:hypothetical protein
MSNQYNISINQGSSFNLSLTATDSSGNALNLSGYSARGKIKYGFGDTGILADLNPVIDTGYISGIINLNIAASITSGLPITKGVYDVEAFNGDGYCFQVIAGYVDINPQVSF